MRNRKWTQVFVLGFLALCSELNAQTFKVLHTFNDFDGYVPYGGVVRDKAGNLYGVTSSGGKYKKGTIFKVAADGTTTVLHNFQDQEGCCSFASPLLDQAGNLFGTNSISPLGPGTMWELRSSGSLAVLIKFNDANGSAPIGGVVRDSVGNVYGTTNAGVGANGTVYEFNVRSKQETILHIFAWPPDGAAPDSTPYRDAQGNIYGTTFNGGAFNWGSVYKIDPTSLTTILYSFTDGTDGKWPTAGVIEDRAGNLYGTSPYGVTGDGVIYMLEPTTGKFTVLHTFTGTDGSMPWGSLVADKAGNLYGTTEYGGVYGAGTVFKLDKAQNLTVLHSFTWQGDGAFPFAPVTLDNAGNLYGTASQGGNPGCDCGVVFEITP